MEGLNLWGASAFGFVVGWITYRTIRRTKSTGLSDIATVIGAIGGAAVIKLFPADSAAFGCYGLGLAVGFLGYLVVSARQAKKAGKSIEGWMGEPPA